MANFRNSSSACRRFSLLLAALFFAAAPPAARAFTFSPIKVELTPSGRGASRAFLVENTTDQTVAVQIAMLTRDIDLHGEEHTAPAEDDFIVYPSQILLKPQQVQTVRVQWVGDAQPEKELAYRILAEQLPIDLTRDQPSGAKINFVIRYLGAVYIVPQGARADIVIESIDTAVGDEGTRQLAIVFHNRGKAHAVLRDMTLTLHAGGQSLELGPDDLKGIAGENLLAEGRRSFVMPRPAVLPDGPVNGTFDFSRRR